MRGVNHILILIRLGDVIVTERGNHQIKKLTKEGRVVIIAGSTKGTFSCSSLFSHLGYADGVGSEAKFNDPRGICLDKDGSYIVTGISLACFFNSLILTLLDDGNHAIRRVSRDGVVSTLTSTTRGYRDGPVNDAMFYHPDGVCSDKQGIHSVSISLNS
jgi:hypothetical protein